MTCVNSFWLFALPNLKMCRIMLQSCCWRSWRVGMTVRMLIVSCSTFNLNSWCVSFVLIIWRFFDNYENFAWFYLFFVTFCILFVCVNSFWLFPVSAVTLLVGHRKGIWPVKKLGVGLCWWQFDWSFARLTAPVITTTSIILSFNKHQLTQDHLENGRENRQRVY